MANTRWQTLLQEASDLEQQAWHIKNRAREARCAYKKGYDGDYCTLDSGHEGEHRAAELPWVADVTPAKYRA